MPEWPSLPSKTMGSGDALGLCTAGAFFSVHAETAMAVSATLSRSWVRMWRARPNGAAQVRAGRRARPVPCWYAGSEDRDGVSRPAERLGVRARDESARQLERLVGRRSVPERSSRTHCKPTIDYAGTHTLGIERAPSSRFDA